MDHSEVEETVEEGHPHALIYRLETSIGFDRKESRHHSTLRGRASVLVPLYLLQNEEIPQVLFNRRSMKLKSHRGQVCFPGGRQDPEDKGDDIVTALRECHEEVGIPPHKIQPLCRLPTMESVNGLCVTPVVGIVHGEGGISEHGKAGTMKRKPRQRRPSLSELKLNPDEVESAFFCPLDYFIRQPPVERLEVDWSGETFIFRQYDYWDDAQDETYKITGLTAHIAHQLASLLYSDHDMIKRDENIRQSGYLWRKVESPTGNLHWKRFYFCLSESGEGVGDTNRTLHQYETYDQAIRKGQAATKKNRLQQLKSAKLSTHDVKDGADRYGFRISVLEGRIEWELAAESSFGRDSWVSNRFWYVCTRFEDDTISIDFKETSNNEHYL